MRPGRRAKTRSPTPPTVVVTGVSTGIGLATARRLLLDGYEVFGSVRTEADCRQLQLDLGPSFTPLLLDVTEESTVLQAAAAVAEALADRALNGLVNNAGIVIAGPSLELPLEAFRRQFEVNLFGQIAVTRAFLPLLARKGGEHAGSKNRIVNMSSVSGRFASPFLAPYAASKFALEAWSDSLRRELLLASLPVDVIIIAPASIRTPIWDKAAAEDPGIYSTTPYGVSLAALAAYAIDEGRRGFHPQRVAETVLAALSARHPKARYHAGGQLSPMAKLFPRLPRRFMDWLISRRFQNGMDPR